jgi:hypothetical protein
MRRLKEQISRQDAALFVQLGFGFDRSMVASWSTLCYARHYLLWVLDCFAELLADPMIANSCVYGGQRPASLEWLIHFFEESLPRFTPSDFVSSTTRWAACNDDSV